MTAQYKTGKGTTIAATGAAPFVGRVRRIGGWSRSVERIDDTALDTDEFAEYIFGQIVEHGSIRVEVLVDTRTMQLANLGTPQNWTITWGSGTVIAGSGAIVSDEMPEVENNTRSVQTFELQFDGKTPPTLTPAP